MSAEGGIHIQIPRLWQHSQQLYPDVLTTTEWHHLMQCEHCCEILKSFYKSESVHEAREMLKNLGIEADLGDGQATA